MSQTGILKKKRKNTECEHTSNQRNIFLQSKTTNAVKPSFQIKNNHIIIMVTIFFKRGIQNRQTNIVLIRWKNVTNCHYRYMLFLTINFLDNGLSLRMAISACTALIQNCRP